MSRFDFKGLREVAADFAGEAPAPQYERGRRHEHEHDRRSERSHRYDHQPFAGAEAAAHEAPQTEERQPLANDAKVSITGKKLLKWGAIFLGVFGAGYVLRGWGESTNGTANLLDALRGRRGGSPEADPATAGLLSGLWTQSQIVKPPSPEELAYWAHYYQRGAQAAGTLPPHAAPRLPQVVQEPMPPPTALERSAERSLLAPERPKRPRYPWGGGGYGGGYGGPSYSDPGFGGGGYGGGGGFPGDEFTIVKE